jgi:hypothetical protein
MAFFWLLFFASGILLYALSIMLLALYLKLCALNVIPKAGQCVFLLCTHNILKPMPLIKYFQNTLSGSCLIELFYYFYNGFS